MFVVRLQVEVLRSLRVLASLRREFSAQRRKGPQSSQNLEINYDYPKEDSHLWLSNQLETLFQSFFYRVAFCYLSHLLSRSFRRKRGLSFEAATN